MSGLGPELAAALGGEWDAKAAEVVLPNGGYVWATATGRVMTHYGQIGWQSDGVEALAAKAREWGVA